MTEPTPAVWSDTDPLMTAIAAAVYEQCERHPEVAVVVDDPRNIAAVAATTARLVLGTPAETPTAPPVDTDLRDRIRRAICEASGFTWLPDELMEPDEYGEHADAVLAVLPAPAEVCICGHTEAQHFEDCCQVCDCGTFLVPEAAREMITHLHAAVLRLKAAAPVDRAAAEQPADRRARYATALEAADEHSCQEQDGVAYRDLADAVMAVADTEQQEMANAIVRFDAALMRQNEKLRAEVERLRTDRARVEHVLETEHVLGRSAETYRRLLRVALMADKAQQPTTAEADPLAECATEYRVPVPENGGTELRLRRGAVPYASGWSVAVPGYGGGMALTELGWSDSIGALSADRLFCWPDPATAVDEARRALAAPAPSEEPTP